MHALRLNLVLSKAQNCYAKDRLWKSAVREISLAVHANFVFLHLGGPRAPLTSFKSSLAREYSWTERVAHTQHAEHANVRGVWGHAPLESSEKSSFKIASESNQLSTYLYNVDECSCK